MESHDEAAVSDLGAKLRAIANHGGPCAKAAADGLPTGFGQVDDVIVLLQPLRLAVENEEEGALEATLRRLAEKNFLTGTQAIGEGGLAAAMVCGCALQRFGFHAELTENDGACLADALFAERRNQALATARSKAHLPLANFVERGGAFTAEAIGRVTPGDVRVQWMGETLLELESLWANKKR